MSIINLQKLDKAWNDRIGEARKELKKMGITKEPLRIMVKIMNSYKADSLSILTNIEKDYSDSIISGNLESKKTKGKF